MQVKTCMSSAEETYVPSDGSLEAIQCYIATYCDKALAAFIGAGRLAVWPV